MKLNQEAENDERLRTVLREWKVDVSLPPRFQEQVWRRVSRAEAQAGPSLRQVLARWVETTFSRPAMAVSYVTVLLFVGLTTGYLSALDKSAEAASEWRTLYVQSVDPYQAPRNY
jgi:hypothetical protein